MEDNIFYSSDCVENSKLPLVYRSGDDYIVYESHPIKNPKLPFIFNRYIVKNRRFSMQEDNICFQYYKCDALNWHENPEFLYVIRGTGTVRCGIQTISVKEGDIVAINSNITHGVCYDSDYEYFCLIIDKDFCTTNGIDVSSMKLATLIHDPETAAKFDDIVSAYKNKKMLLEASLRCTVLDFLINIYEKHQIPEDVSDFTNKSLENINTALGYIEANLSQKLTLDSIAFEVGLSKYHFSREFKKVTGKTVIDYINMRRCETAKRLLINENYSVKETAEKCGFDSLSYFGETFKKHTGFSPSEFKSADHKE